MPAELSILVVGSSGVGKTSLIQRASTGDCPEFPATTIGIDLQAGEICFTPLQDDLLEDLLVQMPRTGLQLQLWEIGGREPEREAPRGQKLDGLIVCYDCSSRVSFQRAAHALVRHRMDSYQRHARLQGHSPMPDRQLPAVLCATKADLEADAGSVEEAEVQKFLQEHQVAAALRTSAKTGLNVSQVFQAIALASIKADFDVRLRQQEAKLVNSAPSAAAFSLRPLQRDSGGGTARSLGPLTSPRGERPHEPSRGSRAQALVEVLPTGAEGGALCAPRPVAVCLERGLLHRAVHVWLWVPRQGALLLRRYAPDALKHPGRWGPTAHGEIRCYGANGDGHAAEISAQAAERTLKEQVGVDAEDLQPMEHWFSCRSHDGLCHELVDVYVAPLGGKGLPELVLHPKEELDWACFEDVLGQDATKAGAILHLPEEYCSSFRRRLEERAVPEDVFAAFGSKDGCQGKVQAPCGARGIRAK